MKYLRLTTTNPYYNLAVEEYLFRHSAEDVLILWQNEPTVVIGKNQNAYAEVDLVYAARKGIHVSRRITGGGAVYHDLGNVNYSLISSESSERILDYAYFTEPILAALRELGLHCELSGRNDLLAEGRKFSGNAQYASGGRILHHGTILFDTDVSVMSDVLKIDKEKLAYRAVKSCKSRVVNLATLLKEPMGVSDFMACLERYLCAHLDAEPMSAPDDPRLSALCERNASEEWILSDRRYLTSYTVTRKKKFPYGLVKVELSLLGDRIEGIRISGDFFGTAPIEELEARLTSQSLSSLPPTDPSPYVSGMTYEELVGLLNE